MVIAGFQPLSLLDYPGKSCSIIFTQGCPFRCPYCHNPELLPVQPEKVIEEELILQYLTKHKKMLDGVCITGGEPTIQAGLRQFIERIKGLGLLVKLDTNGIHPAVVKEFIAGSLIDYFAMDLKHQWEKYLDVVQTRGEKIIKNCRETFEIIQTSGIDHEFRTTILPGVHTETDFFAMAGYLKAGEKYYIQETRFNKTLDQDLSHEIKFEVGDLVRRLQQAFPHLIIQTR
jgi:pyruvate formate lyase activating enzyme